MPHEVKLPDIGEGIAEGEIVRWRVRQGDEVREDQPLVEVMTDKATVEIPSPRAGTVAALHVEEGAMVPVGSVLLTIALPGEEAGDAAGAGSRPAATTAPATAPAGAASAGAGTAGVAPPAAGGRTAALPAVRQMAKRLGVEIEGLAGSGPGGRVTAEDVERAAAHRPAGAGAERAPAEPPAQAPAGPEERIPLRGLRRRIAEHMRRAVDTAAHFTFVAECDMTAVVAHREQLKGRAEAARVKLTYLAYVLKTLVQPLRDFPLLNASLDDERSEIVLKRYYHLGVATSTPEGLTVPVLRDADRLPLLAVAREVQRLSEAARAGRLTLEELQGGTFTVTSTGARGGLLATPILHHPQVAILGVHEVKPRPAVVEGRIVIRDLTNLSLTLDHRVVDGAVGADFLYALIARLEDLSWLTEADLA